MTPSSAADLLLIAVAVLWILTRQVRLGPVKPRLLVLAPLALAYFGLRSMPVAVWKDAADLALLGAAAVVSVALGVWRGRTIAVWQGEDGGWWRRGSWLTVALWVALFAARGLLFVVDRAVGHPEASGAAALLCALAVGFAAQNAVIGWRMAGPGLQSPRPVEAGR